MRILVDHLQCVENGVNMREVNIACDSSEADNRPTDGIVDGSFTLFTDDLTVSFFSEKTGAWGEPVSLFGGSDSSS